jgi:hypothetical protein
MLLALDFPRLNNNSPIFLVSKNPAFVPDRHHYKIPLLRLRDPILLLLLLLLLLHLPRSTQQGAAAQNVSQTSTKLTESPVEGNDGRLNAWRTVNVFTAAFEGGKTE